MIRFNVARTLGRMDYYIDHPTPEARARVLDSIARTRMVRGRSAVRYRLPNGAVTGDEGRAIEEWRAEAALGGAS